MAHKRTLATLALFGALLSAGEAQAACVRQGDVVTCTNETRGSFITEDAVTLTLLGSISNIAKGELLGECPISPPVISVGRGSTVINRGVITGFGTCATGIVTGSDSTIISSGIIATLQPVSHGIDTFNRSSVTLSGSITTQTEASFGIFAGNTAQINITSGASIRTLGAGANALFVSQNSTVTNAGLLHTEGFAAHGIEVRRDFFVQNGSFATIINSGTIEALGIRATGVLADVDAITFTNSGTIRAPSAEFPLINAYGRGVDLTAQTIKILNSGNVLGALWGVQATATQSIDFTNSGTLSATVDVGSAATLIARFMTVSNSGTITGNATGLRLAVTDTLDFTNSGTIEAVGPRGIALDISGNGRKNFTNNGRLVARNGGKALQTDAADDNILNNGEFIGDVDLGGGNDTLTMNANTRIQGTLIGGAGSDRLVLQGQGTLDWSMTGMDELVKFGAGTWTISRNNTLSDRAGISDGELNIANGVTFGARDILILANGRLSGRGTARARVLSSGIIAPGPGFATLTIDGDVVLDATSTLQIDIGTTGVNGRLAATGTAQLGGTLAVTQLTRQRLLGTERYDILTAAQGITGSFARITGVGSTFLAATLNRSPDNRTLSLAFTRIPFASVAQGEAQASVARAIDSAMAANRPGLQTMFDRLDGSDAAAARQAFDHLSPRLPLGVATTTAIAGQSMVSSLIDRLNAPQPNAGPMHLWGTLGRRTGGPESGGDINGYAFHLRGAIAGADKSFDTGTRVGVAIGSQDGHLNYRTVAANADLKQVYFSAYAAHAAPGFNVSAGVLWGDGDIDTTRTNGTLSATANADSGTRGAFLAASKTFETPQALIQPQVAIHALRTTLGSYSENANLGLSLARQTHSSLRPEIALRAEVKSERIHPYVAFALSRELKNRTNAITASLVADPQTSFPITGIAPRRTWATVKAGAQVTLTDNLTAHLGYDGNLTDSTMGQNIFAGLALAW